MNINKSQIEALKQSFLRSLGNNRSDFDLVVLNGVLEKYAEAFLEAAKSNLNKTNSINTGKIADDLTFSIEKGKGSYILSIGYPEDSDASKYYDFVNKGVAGVGKTTSSPYSFKTVNPSKKHVSAIEKWIQSGKAKVQVSDVARYGPTRQESKSIGFRKVEPRSIAYVIARSIKKKGLEATNFFDDAIASVFNGDFRRILSEALAADVEIQLIKTKLN